MKKWMIILVIGLLLITVGLVSVNRSIAKVKDTKELVVFAAASLTDAFSELIERFEEQNEGVEVSLNLASSGKLQIQIEQGAPADIFASAGVKQMNALVEKDLIVEDSAKYFAKNRLVVITNQDSQLKIESPHDLLQSEISRIAIGDPKTTPVGQYSAASLKNLDLWDSLKEKLVYGSNVRQVLQYTERDEVELGFVYATDAAVSDGVKVLYTIPEETHHPIEYPIGVVKSSEDQKLAGEFMEFVLSEEGQDILAKYGFESAQ